MEVNDILVISQSITLEQLKKVASQRFGDMVKAVVDLEKNVMAIGGELHADEEATLLEQGSRQANLWGINLYVDLPPEEMIEFDSMVNIRPSQGNRSRGVDDAEVRGKIRELVAELVK